MTGKYFYLYIIVGSILLILAAYKLLVEKQFSYNVAGSLVPAFVLFYLAYKTYKEKKDSELM